jgi:hypothetical protein
MLTSTDRGGIRDSIVQWSQRKNIPEDVLNDFIELALSKANRALRIPPLEARDAVNVTAGGYIQVPELLLEVKELVIDDTQGNPRIMERKAIHEVDAMNSKARAGVAPVNACIFARSDSQTFRLAPWTHGDVTGAGALYYYTVIPPMTADTDTNWFTLYAPEVLLYGGLAELSSYTRDTDGVQLWSAKFNEAINVLQGTEDRAMWSGSTLGLTLGGST